MSHDLKTILSKFEEDYPKVLEHLKELVRIPSISFEGFPKGELERSAQAVLTLMKQSGIVNSEILQLSNVHPYVYGERIEDPRLPTLLLYAHHDVQPVGRESVWKTKPFEPTEKEGPGGLRLYGRGTSDDKAGILVHLAAIRAYLNATGSLPVNVKVVIDGEEETGSQNLKTFLNHYRDRLDADALVLTDTMNFDVGVPGLTTSLRGLVDVGFEVRSTDRVLHSGLWGGPVPDVAMAITKICASLVDDQGMVAIPEILAEVPELSEQERRDFDALPVDRELIRKQTGVLKDVPLLMEDQNPYELIWRKPMISVNAIQSSSRKQAGNTLNDSAWAKVSVRVPPGMNGDQVMRSLKSAIKKAVPFGCELEFTHESVGSPWSTDPYSKKNESIFQAAKSALEKGYGHKAVYVGCGGTIPFVEPFAEALGGVPALLIGVEDPYTNAHGENESMHLGDFHSACLSQIHLFSELSEKIKK